ncbi:MAG: sigma-70 family RNA polymerase sigma factor [Acidobacteriia bacterium]|nr:sigma-70 family RNA polymerase sigma factor [Terriglobia bacterium]
MEARSEHAITQLLRAWGDGDQEALRKLTPLVHAELHRAAHRHMARERPGHTLQTTALVNEVYLRLVDAREVTWQDRAHFFAICARMMRRILIDFARARQYVKRGGKAHHVSLDEALVVPREAGGDLVALDDALNQLAAVDERKSRVVELRYFGGLSVEETAEALKVSPETVMRDWKLAKAWLRRELCSPRPHEA